MLGNKTLGTLAAKLPKLSIHKHKAYMFCGHFINDKSKTML